MVALTIERIDTDTFSITFNEVEGEITVSAEEAYDLLCQLYQMRNELHRLVQHSEQRAHISMQDKTREDYEAYSDELAANSIGLEARDEIVDWMMSRKDEEGGEQ